MQAGKPHAHEKNLKKTMGEMKKPFNKEFKKRPTKNAKQKLLALKAPLRAESIPAESDRHGHSALPDRRSGHPVVCAHQGLVVRPADVPPGAVVQFLCRFCDQLVVVRNCARQVSAHY